MERYKQTWRAHFHHRRYRTVYEIFKSSKTVVVFRMKPRPVVYVGLKRPDKPTKR